MNRHLIWAPILAVSLPTSGMAKGDPNLPSNAGRAALIAAARCLTKQEPQAVRDLVTKNDPDRGVAKLMDRNRPCVGNNLPDFPDGLVRGALAEAAFAVDYGPFTLSKVTNEQWAKSRSMPQTSTRKVAICLEEDRPMAVEQLILSVPGSAQEQSAIAELQTQLQRCAGEPVSYYPAVFRAQLAVWAYRTASFFSIAHAAK